MKIVEDIELREEGDFCQGREISRKMKIRLRLSKLSRSRRRTQRMKKGGQGTRTTATGFLRWSSGRCTKILAKNLRPLRTAHTGSHLLFRDVEITVSVDTLRVWDLRRSCLRQPLTPGVATGLSYSSSGNGVLSTLSLFWRIQLHRDRVLQLHVTGSLKDVMKNLLRLPTHLRNCPCRKVP